MLFLRLASLCLGPMQRWIFIVSFSSKNQRQQQQQQINQPKTFSKGLIMMLCNGWMGLSKELAGNRQCRKTWFKGIVFLWIFGLQHKLWGGTSCVITEEENMSQIVPQAHGFLHTHRPCRRLCWCCWVITLTWLLIFHNCSYGMMMSNDFFPPSFYLASVMLWHVLLFMALWIMHPSLPTRWPE